MTVKLKNTSVFAGTRKWVILNQKYSSIKMSLVVLRNTTGENQIVLRNTLEGWLSESADNVLELESNKQRKQWLDKY